MFQKNTGLPVVVYPRFHLTRLLDGDPHLNTGVSVLVYPNFRLTRLLGGTEWLISFEGVVGVEVDELDEELLDKAGTTIGTKSSVLHCIWTPF